MSLDLIALWHKRARPEPGGRDFDVQLGCHLEEVAEMLEALVFHFDSFPDTPGKASSACQNVKLMANMLKSGKARVTASDREGLLDALCDQVVTALGAGHCARMDMLKACGEVNSSNWSKFDDNGQPLFDADGKVIKGPNYRRPNLTGMY